MIVVLVGILALLLTLTNSIGFFVGVFSRPAGTVYLGTIHYFALLGMFVGAADTTVDAFIVGKLNRPSLARLMRQFERELARPMNYTVMSEREFRYRWDVGDRFLYGILEGKKIVVIDELTPAAKAAANATMV